MAQQLGLSNLEKTKIQVYRFTQERGYRALINPCR